MSVEVSLHAGSLTATVSEDGGRLVELSDGDTPLLLGRGAPETFPSALLAPWPNLALDGGSWSWRGRELRLPGERANPLHGLVYAARFTLSRPSLDTARCTLSMPAVAGYPFALEITADYRLHEHGIDSRLAATNRSAEAAPIGLGVHPYVLAPQGVDRLEIRFAARSAHQLAGTGLEEVPRPACLDGSWHEVGDAVLDHALRPQHRDGDGTTSAHVRTGGHELRVWSGPTCRWLQLYTADESPGDERRRGLGVEPMTCPPDALRAGAADVVEPGDSLELSWGIDVVRRPGQAVAR